MPLRNTRLIHPRWRPWHEQAIAQGWTGRVRLSKPGGLGARDPGTGRTPVLPAARYYEGPARVASRGPAAPAASSGQREVTAAPYLVAVPVELAGAVPERGDLVEVLDADDPALVGARLYVTDIPTSTVILQRDLGCDLHRPTTPGG